MIPMFEIIKNYYIILNIHYYEQISEKKITFFKQIKTSGDDYVVYYIYIYIFNDDDGHMV